MRNGRFSSGSFSETSKFNAEAKKKEDSKENKFIDIEESFLGRVIDKSISLSGINNGSFKVVSGGKLTISGNFTGEIMIAGGRVSTSGIFNGRIVMTRGKLNMPGIKNGALRYIGGEFDQSGINNMQITYQ